MASKKPPIELPQSYYDNAMPRKRQIPNKDATRTRRSKGVRTIYRKPKNDTTISSLTPPSGKLRKTFKGL
jgi:hypothetical protein